MFVFAMYLACSLAINILPSGWIELVVVEVELLFPLCMAACMSSYTSNLKCLWLD